MELVHEEWQHRNSDVKKAHEIKTTDKGVNPLHDIKGNMTHNSNGQIYTWDIENRLDSAQVPLGTIPETYVTHTYRYNALGSRVSKTIGAVSTVFVNDGLQEICEYENGTFARSYVIISGGLILTFLERGGNRAMCKISLGELLVLVLSAIGLLVLNLIPNVTEQRILRSNSSRPTTMPSEFAYGSHSPAQWSYSLFFTSIHRVRS